MIATLPRRSLSDVRVTLMRRRHLRQVLRIEAQVYPRPWSPQLFATELSRGDSRHYVVATVASARRWWPARDVVGYAGILLQPGETGTDAHITTVAVDPRQHRRKIASHLLLAVLGEARRVGAQAATLEVRVANRGAQRLYAHFGFAPVGVRPGYYAETGEDALIMWLHELQGPEMDARLAAQAARVSEPGGASGVPDLHVPWVKGRVGLPGADRVDAERRSVNE